MRDEPPSGGADEPAPARHRPSAPNLVLVAPHDLVNVARTVRIANNFGLVGIPLLMGGESAEIGLQCRELALELAQPPLGIGETVGPCAAEAARQMPQLAQLPGHTLTGMDQPARQRVEVLHVPLEDTFGDP